MDFLTLMTEEGKGLHWFYQAGIVFTGKIQATQEKVDSDSKVLTECGCAGDSRGNCACAFLK